MDRDGHIGSLGSVTFGGDRSDFFGRDRVTGSVFEAAGGFVEGESGSFCHASFSDGSILGKVIHVVSFIGH